MFDDWGLEDDLAAALAPMVSLPGGGRLWFEATRLAQCIDVDRGGSALGEAAFARMALETALRHIHLRGLTGCILIDLPRLKSPAARAALLDHAKDWGASWGLPHRATVHGFTRTGLLELSRPRGRLPLADRLPPDRAGFRLLAAMQRAAAPYHAIVGPALHAWLNRPPACDWLADLAARQRWQAPLVPAAATGGGVYPGTDHIGANSWAWDIVPGIGPAGANRVL